MDLSIYFEPITIENKPNNNRFGTQIVSNTVLKGFPELKEARLVLFGISSDKTKRNVAEIRNYLYHLAKIDSVTDIADLGNIVSSVNQEDTLFAIKDVVAELTKQNKIVVIIHGQRLFTHAIYSAFSELEQLINLTIVDQTIQLGAMSEELNSDNYLSKIMLSSNNYLFNFSQIAHQAHFTGQEQLALLDRLNFDHVRLGEIRANVESVEPVFRNTDVSIFNLSAVRKADAPGCQESGPNGLFGEEYCRLARYAGVSDKNSVAAFFEYDHKLDLRGGTAHLQAQAIWYFIEGVGLRKGDFPIGTKEHYTKYIVDAKNGEVIEFLKSDKSERWWITVPVPAGKAGKYFRHHLIPCTYHDYQLACNNEIPDIWIKTIQKLT